MEKELKSIIDHSVEYATELLEQGGELHPFGAFTDLKGQVHPLEMEINKKNVPTNGKIIETLWNYCFGEMEAKKITAFGITFESALKLEEGKDSVDVIVIIPNHNSREDLPAYCTPFNISKEGKVEIGEIFAVDKKYFN
jgi:hypothetical protein